MGQDTSIDSGLELVWTGKGSAVFFPRGTRMRAAGISDARATMLELRSDSGDIEVAIGYQTSDTGEDGSWGTATLLSASYQSSTGLYYATGFTDLSSITKRFVRFGFIVRNVSLSGVEVAQVAGKIDIREH